MWTTRGHLIIKTWGVRKTTDEVQACWRFLFFDYNKPFFWSALSAHTPSIWIEIIMNVQKQHGHKWERERESSLEREWERGKDRERRALVEKPERPCKVHRLAGQTTVGVQRDARKLGGMTEAERKTWPDYCATFSSKTKEPFNFTNSLLFIYLFIFLHLFRLYFLSFSSDPAEIHALYFFFFFLTISLLNSLTWLQPEGFFRESGATRMC